MEKVKKPYLKNLFRGFLERVSTIRRIIQKELATRSYTWSF
jgi:hypothetical protein